MIRRRKIGEDGANETIRRRRIVRQRRQRNDKGTKDK